jgi:hypothetical protein
MRQNQDFSIGDKDGIPTKKERKGREVTTKHL